ncbi:hypothetical protein [Dyadobacter sediminis]|uniref:Uncharacterized protein n=1 Tax=Dyadobacter sediminis TaxID=1493691 RepID=A0A5R9K907_9BACT|nr:hypothetical protein [Dyadobacter sediminis]TLU90597.1 hypothetical protein FEM55_18760 [Dyadobacter sediminis]GGC09075.1 hypothetical protein GCM10011325_40040 [Dyadobacter sediminis]
MPRKPPKNQLLLDYSVRGDRIVLHLGETGSQQVGNRLFEGLVNGEWMIEPAGEAADISYAQDILNQIGHKLPYPEVVKIAQMHDADPVFKGFSAIFDRKGWIFVNAAADIHERNYHIHLLAVSLGLHASYANPETLLQRSEKLIFDVMLPFKEVESFFRTGISRIPASLAAEIAGFFKVPFAIVLKRALSLEIITDEQYRSFVKVKPAVPSRQRELFVSKEGNMDDLETQLFSQGLEE